MRHLYARAVLAWPDIRVPAARFEALVEAKLAGSARDPADVSELHGADLYLACACADGDARALAVFEEQYLATSLTVLGRLRLDPAELDEVLQRVREKLLVTTPERPARILDLTGRGDLGALVRVAALRTAINFLRAERRHSPDPEGDLADALVGEVDPAAAIAGAQARGEIKRAFERALTRLDARQRNLLRLYLLHELTIDDLGRLHQVHRATAARWLERIRDQLRRDTRSALAAECGGADLDALLGLADSQLEVSFERLLA